MKHRIYITCPSEYWDRAWVMGGAIIIELGDARIVSRWCRSPVEKYPDAAHIRAEQLAKNLSDIEQATVIVALVDLGQPRTTFADVGYGLALGKPVIWVKGQLPSQQCLFDAHASVRVYEPLPYAPVIEIAKEISRIVRESATEAA